MSNYIADLSALAGTNAAAAAGGATKKKNNDLTMEDFLTLMIVQLQNQTIDDTADTSEMLNQMVQMQMITALTNMTDASLMGYASSLVGKEVTVGVSDGKGVEERVITVTGTGMYDGEQVIFGSDGNTYALSQIMAVGRLPEIDQPDTPGDSTDKPVEGPDGPGEGTDKPEDSTDKPVDGTEKPEENPDKPTEGTQEPSGDRPVTPEGGTDSGTPEENGGDTVDPAAATEGT